MIREGLPRRRGRPDPKAVRSMPTERYDLPESSMPGCDPDRAVGNWRSSWKFPLFLRGQFLRGRARRGEYPPGFETTHDSAGPAVGFPATARPKDKRCQKCKIFPAHGRANRAAAPYRSIYKSSRNDRALADCESDRSREAVYSQRIPQEGTDMKTRTTALLFSMIGTLCPASWSWSGWPSMRATGPISFRGGSASGSRLHARWQ